MKLWRNIKDFSLSFRYSYSKCFLVSFPKAGRTWLLYMLSQIEEETRNNIALEPTHDLSEIIIENGFRQNPNLLFKCPDRFFYRRSKIIFLVRDPRDVVVSHYHQVTKRAKDPFVFSSISDFVRDDVLGFRRIIHFYNLWFRSSHIPLDFLLVKYENLLNNGEDELFKICSFLGVDVDKDTISYIYSNSSSSKMRKREMENRLEGFNDFGKEKDKLKVRNAKINGYKDELSKSDINYCNFHMQNLNAYFEYLI